MTVQFETVYGKISCNSATKIAYLHKGDMEAPINDLGDFIHPFSETKFTVHWPLMAGVGYRKATLDAWYPRKRGIAEID